MHVCVCINMKERKGTGNGRKDNCWQACTETGSLCVMDRFENGATATENSIKAP